MLRVQHVSYSLPDRVLLDDVTFDLSDGERVGLIGRNGGGKTTLLRLVTGELAPDSGLVERVPHATLGYVRQGFLDRPDATAAAVLGPAGVAWHMERELASLGDAMATETTTTLLARYGEAQAQHTQAGGAAAARATHAALAGLGLADLAPETPVDRLSGGQRTRLELARLTLAAPDLLVLDEPTNHLDLGGLLWLEGFLHRFTGAVLLVSHDRAFLDGAVSRVLALEEGTVQSYAGGYSAYAESRQRAEAEQWQTYRRQERQRERIEEQLRRDQERARRTELTTVDFALRAKAKKGARQAKVKERRLERAMQATEWVEKPQASWDLRLDFGAVPPTGRQVLVAERLGFAYGGRRVLDGVDLRIGAGERVVLTGPNGGGKSSLLRLLAGAATPQVGSVTPGPSTRVGYLEQDQWDLPPDATPLGLVRADAVLDETAARSYLHFFLFVGEQAFTPVSHLSYGERSRLRLALILLSGSNLLLLDEPLNHLDIPARERLEQAVVQFPGAALIVTHDRAFMRAVATRCVTLDAGRLYEAPLP